MSEFDVVSLVEAKESLVVDYSDRDVEIQRYIKTAVQLVERTTNHLLYNRSISYTIPGCGYLEIYDYPISIDPEDVTLHQNVLSVTVKGKSDMVVLATAGYQTTDIPSPLKDACLKIILYLFENKDIYEANLPFDIQLMLNPYKRSATF